MWQRQLSIAWALSSGTLCAVAKAKADGTFEPTMDSQLAPPAVKPRLASASPASFAGRHTPASAAATPPPPFRAAAPHAAAAAGGRMAPTLRGAPLAQAAAAAAAAAAAGRPVPAGRAGFQSMLASRGGGFAHATPVTTLTPGVGTHRSGSATTASAGAAAGSRGICNGGVATREELEARIVANRKQSEPSASAAARWTQCAPCPVFRHRDESSQPADLPCVWL